MRILITGAGGFVGGAVARALAGHELVLPSRDPDRLRAAGLTGAFPPFTGELEAQVTAADMMNGSRRLTNYS